jgi:hypothetical protein
MNKKGFFYVLIALAIVGGAAFSYNMNAKSYSYNLSGVALANIEALASGEINPDCPNGCLVECSDGCFCYKFYPIYKEAPWP